MRVLLIVIFCDEVFYKKCVGMDSLCGLKMTIKYCMKSGLLKFQNGTGNKKVKLIYLRV